MDKFSCFCGSEKQFCECCEPILMGKKIAPSAEALMRSRYCAFVTKNMDYLAQSIDSQALDQFDTEANKEWAETADFLGLEIVDFSEDGNKATVEFKAKYKIKGQPDIQIHHERSRFRKKAGIWYFREGKILSN